MALLGQRHLKAFPVDPHHLPERYALFTIILLGESIVSLASTFKQVAWSGIVLTAGISGFVLSASIWWMYFENFERYIYGHPVKTGQTVIYLHLFIYIGLGGIANAIHFAIVPQLTLYDYKLLAGSSAVCFMLALQLLQLTHHPRDNRRGLLTNASIFYALVTILLLIAPTVLIVILSLCVAVTVYTLADVINKNRRML